MKKLALALSAGTLTVGIVAGVLWKQLNTERDQLADLRTRVTEMENAQAAAAASAAQPPPAIAAAAAPGTAVAAPSSAPEAATSTNPGSPARGVAQGLAAVMSSPEASDMIRGQVRAALAQQFPDLAAELRLSTAEAEKLMDLLARQATDLTGDVFGVMGGGNSAAAQESQRKMIEKQLANEKEIARTLGSRYPAWQEYQGTATARQQVSQLRALLGTGEDALSEAQSKPVIAALGTEQTRINKEEQDRMSSSARSSQNINVLEDQLKSMSAYNSRLVSAASSHLTSNQLDRYKRMLEQQEALLRTIVSSMNTQGNAATQTGAPR
jgi:hypothetical protein